MKYYLIVGEASGDLHASHLMKELKARDAEADFRFLGGDLMKAQSRESGLPRSEMKRRCGQLFLLG